MAMRGLFYVLIQGFLIGAGPCVLTCAPVIVPFIAGTQRSWVGGLKATLIFSLTRLAVYTAFGAVSGWMGVFLVRLYVETPFAFYIWAFGAAILMIIGSLMIFSDRLDMPLCRYLDRNFIKEPTASMVLFGLLIGASPCLPLIGIMAEIAIFAGGAGIGALYGFTFGIGTVISPLLLLGAAAPLFTQRMIRRESVMKAFSVACGITLIMVGLFILVSRA